MAGLNVISFAVLTLVVVASVARAQRVSCNYTEIQGPYCHDCNTRAICTPIGGIPLKCWLPWLAHCVDGHCANEPSAECSNNPTSPPSEPTTSSPTNTTSAPSNTTSAPVNTTSAPVNTTSAPVNTTSTTASSQSV